MITKRKTENRARLKRHIRLTISGTPDCPRMTVFRSIKHVYIQIVDDQAGKTLVSVSDLSKGVKESLKEAKGQVALAREVGKAAAREAQAKNISKVVFDRNGYLYHGVVKAIADGAREGGLKF
ncbi:MAG: rplR [Bacteroidetes bacterium]|jgi:large subunit ribosomal protein L18|nr:rplR [Bacteroidota bacterium]